MAQTRNHFGDFIEELAATLGYGDRLRTDGTCDYCPDVQRQASKLIYYETKSVGKNGAVIIYEARREKDRKFEYDGESRTLFYWIFHHNLSADSVDTVEGLRGGIARTLKEIIVLPFFLVDRAAEKVPLRMLNKQYTGGGTELGYGNRSKGYGDGRSIRLSLLREQCNSVIRSRQVRLLD